MALRTHPYGCGREAIFVAVVSDSEIRTDLNAARTSAAGDGSTEPLLDFIESLILRAVFMIHAANPENSIEK